MTTVRLALLAETVAVTGIAVAPVPPPASRPP